MWRFKVVLMAMALFFQTESLVLAELIYQSGTVGQTGITNEQVLAQQVLGANVSAFNFVGARFRIEERMATTRIGGHFVGGFQESDFFGAIVRLTSPTDHPDSHDLSTPDLLGISRLSFPDPSDEVFGDLALPLEPGWYALVFGTGLFGTDGRGAAVRNGEDIGSPSYINWQPSNGWFNLSDLGFAGLGNRRFVVEGKPIPQPSSLELILAAAMLFFFRRVSLALRNRLVVDFPATK